MCNDSATEYSQVLYDASLLVDHTGYDFSHIGLPNIGSEEAERRVGQEQTLQSLMIKALVLRGRGKLDDAEGLSERALAESICTLGEDHQVTHVCKSNLASVFLSQGKCDAAEKLSRQAVDGLGNTIPASRFCLASSLTDLGRLEEAEEVLTAIPNKALEEDNLIALMKMYGLVCIRLFERKWEEAEELNRPLVALLAKKLGENHPDTLSAISLTVYALSQRGKHAKAAELAEQNLDETKTALGKRHPDTLRASDLLASILYAQTQYEQARKILQPALEVSQAVRGLSHPETLNITSGLAASILGSGNHSEAIKMQKQLIRDAKRALGKNHSRTQAYTRDLEMMHQYQPSLLSWIWSSVRHWAQLGWLNRLCMRVWRREVVGSNDEEK